MPISPAPSSLDEVLDPSWLSAALSRPGAPVEVVAVEVVETLTTMATKVRVRLDYAQAVPDLGRDLCVKGFFLGEHPPSRTRNAVFEARFYREIAPSSGNRLPLCRYAGIDEDAAHGVIVMDDVIAAGGSFLTALTPYSPEQVRQTVDEMARIHAQHWGEDGLASLPWLRDRLAGMVERPSVSVDRIQELFAGERGSGLPSAVTDGARIQAAVARLAAVTSTLTPCLVHGDAHAGNVFQQEGRLGLVDWQLIQRGHWALDLSYHIGTTLTVADREASEVDLLRHYLERRGRYGAPVPDWDDAWSAYAASMAYGYYLWCITQRVEPAITNELVHRLGTAVAGLSSFDRLGVPG